MVKQMNKRVFTYVSAILADHLLNLLFQGCHLLSISCLTEEKNAFSEIINTKELLTERNKPGSL